MKKTALLAILCGALAIVSCKKPDDNKQDPIDIEKEYTELYALGASVNKWDSMDPEPMKKVGKNLFEIEVDLIKSNENKLIKFCTTKGLDWSQTDYLVPATVEADKPYGFLKEGDGNKLQHSSEKADGVGNLKDWFFGLEAGKSGHYRLTVNPYELTVKAEKLSSLPDKAEAVWEEGMVYMVGDATPAGWDINSPTAMVKNGDIFTYEGPLTPGEMKFPVEFRWDGPTYMAEEAGTDITAGGDFTVVLSPNGDPDNKFKVTAAGNYKLTLDTKNLKLKVEAK
ncbi:MAG: SusF/SusE family outer membrane protein [Bacteroidales bacterium]|nr:SusF/SusE family outer membrane protein [Bacteroidales bacterium]